MRISRIYTSQPLQPGAKILLDKNPTHYLSRVLKMKTGNPLLVFNGDGFDYSAEILSIGRNESELAINTQLPAAREPVLKITLVQAISRGERMDYCLQKATELASGGGGGVDDGLRLRRRVPGPDLARSRLQHHA